MTCRTNSEEAAAIAIPVYSRPAEKRFLGNENIHEVHDLSNEQPNCQIDEIFRSVHAVVFPYDSLLQAHEDGYTDCIWCLGPRA